jgi:hypothetical protein
MDFRLGASSLFHGLQELAKKPLPKGTKVDLCWNASIVFPSDEESHNDDLQAAARSLADSLLALVEAGAGDTWGEPDYRLRFEDDEFPAWTEDLLTGPVFTRLVGWRRGRTMVAFALHEQEDREIPLNVTMGVVRWRAGTIANDE